MKIISYVIPCYNSAEYMDHCIESLLPGGDDVEIIIVDDGSQKDNTPQKADEWAEKYPDIIRAIHQENKGHGGAVNTGIAAATGMYFKVVDSDDWLDVASADIVLSKIREFIKNDTPVDMIIANYVYEHVVDNTSKEINYEGAIPKNKIITWDDLGKFKPAQNLLMHSVIYRTEALRESGLKLPEHTFYVDNIFVFQPFPYMKTLYYLSLPLYRYFIGREDQSVAESVMVGRVDQQIKITKIMIDCEVEQKELVKSEKLRAVRWSYIAMMMAISSAMLLLAKTPEALEKRRELWRYLRAADEGLWRRCRFGIRNLATNLHTPVGRGLSLVLYRITQKIYKFN